MFQDIFLFETRTADEKMTRIVSNVSVCYTFFRENSGKIRSWLSATDPSTISLWRRCDTPKRWRLFLSSFRLSFVSQIKIYPERSSNDDSKIFDEHPGIILTAKFSPIKKSKTNLCKINILKTLQISFLACILFVLAIIAIFCSYMQRQSSFRVALLTNTAAILQMKSSPAYTHCTARSVHTYKIGRWQTRQRICIRTRHFIPTQTFIHIHTVNPWAIVASLAGTTEASSDIYTVCSGVAVVWLHSTLVNIHTVGAITDIACWAVQTDIRSGCVLTSSCWVTAVSSFTAFVDIRALHSRSFISFITQTRETAHGVCASGHLMTLTFKAFIHIIACCPIASMSISTNTNIRSTVVIAECKGRVARVNLLSAFINICATLTIAPVTSIAQTGVTALVIYTSCIRVTRVRPCCAFIDVITLDSISRKSQWAATSKTAIDVCTSCIWMAARMISI